MRRFQRNYFVAAHGAMKPSGELSNHADSLIREAEASDGNGRAQRGAHRLGGAEAGGTGILGQAAAAAW